MKKYVKFWLEILAGLCLFLVVISTFLQVILRFVFKIPAPWTEEVTRISFAYMVFLGAVLGAKYNMHLSVDVLKKLPRKLRQVILSVGYFLCILFVAVFTYYGWLHAVRSKIQYTPTLEISLFFIYLILPISGVLMIYYLLKNLFAELRDKGVMSK